MNMSINIQHSFKDMLQKYKEMLNKINTLLH